MENFQLEGPIIDIYPGGYKNPIRIDLNDIEVETIKSFNTHNQITITESEKKDAYIVPMNNMIYGEDNIISFRKKFREIFEGNPNNSDVYSGISNGLIPQGFNNYFPLLFNQADKYF